mmetsp:Transcript_3224/g.7660  ORF Transcript_3224/g.7660 Transcript_3224/m.7660 type:complete len:96 (-) Transcript_3224:227-514(-)
MHSGPEAHSFGCLAKFRCVDTLGVVMRGTLDRAESKKKLRIRIAIQDSMKAIYGFRPAMRTLFDEEGACRLDFCSNLRKILAKLICLRSSPRCAG